VTRTDDVTVRRATVDDAVAIADLYSAARKRAVPQMPPAMHTNAEDRAYVAARLAEDEVTMWVAEAEGEDGHELLGFASCTSTWLNGLYVRPDLKGRGIGSLLLDVVEATHPDGYELWVFESNLGARRLYERRGLVEVERTDGSGNEEKAPDIRMAWRPTSS
jgi:GNAT superfamily N-acetyltransferase